MLTRKPPQINVENRPGAGRTAVPATDFRDFVIRGARRTPGEIVLRVDESPSGRVRATRVTFSDAEARELRAAFAANLDATAGRMLSSQAEATEMGKRLAEVLLTGPVFRLLAESLARCASRPDGGLRIRLALDPTLIDLPLGIRLPAGSPRGRGGLGVSSARSADLDGPACRGSAADRRIDSTT